jgi:hypothetical protein
MSKYCVHKNNSFSLYIRENTKCLNVGLSSFFCLLQNCVCVGYDKLLVRERYVACTSRDVYEHEVVAELFRYTPSGRREGTEAMVHSFFNSAFY